MKKISVIVLLLITVGFEPLYPQQNMQNAAIRDTIPNADYILANTSQAKDFWIAVPLNESKARQANALELYVASIYNTTVTVEVPGSGFILTRKIVANQTTVFTTKSGSFSWDFEIQTFEVAENKAIHVFADKPISVYVVNSKTTSTDGFMALPTNSFGTDYIHCSYYDFFAASSFKCGGGFIVIATEDATNVSINLKGRGASSGAKTRGGSSIGDDINVTLSRGQVYNVIGDATTRGEFDLTGSRITSNKPIGLISYNESTYIPSDNSNGAEHLVEMLRPVTAWGKTYTSVELDRSGKGDYFRVVASENNTKWKMRYYDMSTGTLLGQRSGVLQAGQFYADYDTYGGSAIAFRGISVWEADKPILVMQYGYSFPWDNGSDDPTMFMITPTEQYVQSSIIQAPLNSTFTSNLFTFIVKGDPTDTNATLLKSFTFDGVAVYKSYPQLLLNRIPGTDYYWGRKKIDGGFHSVSSETLFSGYVNAPGSPQANYSWPAATSTRAIDEFDSLPPVLIRTFRDNITTYQATETRNFTTGAGIKHVDQGIVDVYLVDSVSTNYKLTYLSASKIVPLPKISNFEFDLTPLDSTKKAYAIIVVIDRAGNYSLDTVSYIPQAVVPAAVFAQSIDFGKVTVGEFKDSVISALITNIGSAPLIVYDATIDSVQFSISSAGGGFTVLPGQRKAITIKFIPLTSGTIVSRLTLIHNAANSPTQIILSGEGIAASVPVVLASAGIDLGKVPVGTTKDSIVIAIIKNVGAVPLAVTSSQLSGTNASSFQILSGGGNFSVGPSQSHDITIGFIPTGVGKVTAAVTFIHNGTNSPTSIPLTAEGIPATSVDDELQTPVWELFSEHTTIHARCACSIQSNATLTLYDVLGREVGLTSSETGTSLFISTVNLPTGLYVATLTINGKIIGKTFVIQ